MQNIKKLRLATLLIVSIAVLGWGGYFYLVSTIEMRQFCNDYVARALPVLDIMHSSTEELEALNKSIFEGCLENYDTLRYSGL